MIGFCQYRCLKRSNDRHFIIVTIIFFHVWIYLSNFTLPTYLHYKSEVTFADFCYGKGNNKSVFFSNIYIEIIYHHLVTSMKGVHVLRTTQFITKLYPLTLTNNFKIKSFRSRSDGFFGLVWRHLRSINCFFTLDKIFIKAFVISCKLIANLNKVNR